MAEGFATGAAQVGVGGDREHVLCCSKEMCERLIKAPPPLDQPLTIVLDSRA